MPLSKEHLQRVLARLEADVASLPVPKDLSLYIPIAELYGLPPVPNPIYVESGKVYLFEFLMADQQLILPGNPSPGFSFEVWGVELDNQFPARIEMTAPNALVVGDCNWGGSVIGNNLKFAMDGSGPNREAVRITFIGEIDYTLFGYGVFKLWKMERLDDFSNTTKFVHYATTAALPAYTMTGDHADRVLTAVGAGPLVVDGRTYSETPPSRDKILVKNEGSGDINGIYRLIQTDPWKLRRAAIDQNEWQVSWRGAFIQVMFGAVNGGKQFFRDHYTSNVNPAGGGGGGGGVLTDVLVSNSVGTLNAAVDNFYTLWHETGGNLAVNLPSPGAGLVGKEIGFKRQDGFSWGTDYVVFNTAIDNAGGYRLDTAWELIMVRCVEYPLGAYGWVQVG